MLTLDANECILRTANCPANSACVNQNPGYECRCLTGYQKVGSLCIGKWTTYYNFIKDSWVVMAVLDLISLFEKKRFI